MKYFIFFLLISLYSCTDKKNNPQKTINPLYEKAFDYKDSGKIDSAFLYFYKAKDIFIQQKDNFGAGKCLANLAMIQETKGDFFGSQETGLSALKYFDSKDSLQYKYLSINYNTLGIASSKLENYSKAIEFYQMALSFAADSDDKMIYQNNLANSYAKAKDYGQALKILDNTLKSDNNGARNYSRALTNFAKTKWLQNPDYNPVPEFQKALNIRLKEKDNWGLNSSYSHLADYYSEIKSDSALFFAKKMYETATEIKSPDDRIESLQKLISLENPEKSKQYFNIYQNLNDSLQASRNKAKNQFALIRYETEKNKADFLKAKAESEQRQNEIIKRNIGLLILFLTLLFGFLYYKRRQKILHQEKLLEVKNTELKYSKKVHDRVANKVYQVMSEVENFKDFDRTTLLDRLEEIYEISRDISYEKEESENQNFRDHLANMLKSYASDSVKIFITGNDEEIWNQTNHNQQNEVYCILQELMTNMKKHSQADKVFLKFIKENSQVTISYIDNGVGIKEHLPKNGLRNTETRINAISGTIIFDTETDRLLKINITFPV